MRLCVQDVVTDFDSHHIGLQQPRAQAHQETDTHLHHQPAPDVTSTHHTSTFAAPNSPVLPPAASPSHASVGAAESTTATTHRQQQQTQGLEAPSSSTQHTFNQTNTAALPHSGSDNSAVPATTEPTQQQPSSSMHDASAQQPASTSDLMYPPPPTTSQQPQAVQQPAVHARSETPSYTPSDVLRTGQTGPSQSEGMSVQTQQHQQEPETYSAVSAPADATARDVKHVDDVSSRQTGLAEQTRASAQQNAVDSAASADREQGPASSASAAHNESQQADVTAATTSDGQQEDGVNPAPNALPDAEQPPEPAAPSSSAHARQQGEEAERGAGFPAGPVGKTT